MQNYTWAKRDIEWIKQNPGKGTMYKVYEGQTETKQDIKPIVKEVKQIVKVNLPPKVKNPISKFGGVYAIINEHSKLIYVGQSLSPKVKLRYHKMHISANSKDLLYKLMIEHKEHLKYIVLELDISVSELTHKEAEYIKQYISQGYKLYNIYVPYLCMQ